MKTLLFALLLLTIPGARAKGGSCCPLKGYTKECRNRPPTETLPCVCINLDAPIPELPCDSACCVRRLGESSFEVTEGDKDYQAIAEQCGNVEYEVSLYVTDHLYAVARPTVATCPWLVTHADFEQDNTAQKSIHVLDDADEAHNLFQEETLYPLGNFQLTQLASAVEKADPAAAGEYHPITNTCAHYLLELAQGLEVPVDASMSLFVARRLLASKSQGFLDSIRQHVHYDSLLQKHNLRGEHLDDEDLVELLEENEELLDLFVEKEQAD